MFQVDILKIDDYSKLEEIFKDDNMVLNYESIKRFLNNDNSYGFVVRDIISEKIVGFAYGYSLPRPDMRGDMFYLHSIGVLPNYQGKKCGSLLMNYIIDFAKEKNFSEIFVITNKSNMKACNLYLKFKLKSESNDDVVFVREF